MNETILKKIIYNLCLAQLFCFNKTPYTCNLYVTDMLRMGSVLKTNVILLYIHEY